MTDAGHVTAGKKAAPTTNPSHPPAPSLRLSPPSPFSSLLLRALQVHRGLFLNSGAVVIETVVVVVG